MDVGSDLPALLFLKAGFTPLADLCVIFSETMEVGDRLLCLTGGTSFGCHSRRALRILWEKSDAAPSLQSKTGFARVILYSTIPQYQARMTTPTIDRSEGPTMHVYLDNNSTTQVDPRVVDAMVPCFRKNYGNPSSAHWVGAEAGAAVEWARQQIADLLNAETGQIVFCSSATEAINTVVRSAGVGEVVTSCVEHAATLESAASLVKHGGTITAIGVDSAGALDLAMLERAVARGPKLVSVMWVNNETGIIFPIADVARLCQAGGVPLHVDAVQAVGKIDVDLMAVPISFLSISSHKIFGPKGVGALFVRDEAGVRPLIVGGGQERGLRAGTENVPGIVGFGEAARLARAERSARVSRVAELRDYFERGLACIPNACVNGGQMSRVANTSNVRVADVDSGDLVAVLSGMGIAVSNGSACNAKSLAPSHVIQAMTGSRKVASESLRFSLSHANTFEEMDYVLQSLKSAIDLLDAPPKRKLCL